MAGTLDLSGSKLRNLVYAAGMRHDYQLLEVTDDLLQKIQHSEVVIKGGSQHDEAVLCTQDKTYALKYVETTNCLLLVPPEQGRCDELMHDPEGSKENAPADYQRGLQTQIQHNEAAQSQPPVVARAMAKAHIEVMEIAPKLEAVEQLLRRCPYPLPHEEDGEQEDSEAIRGESVALTFEQLVSRVQASRQEIQAVLGELGAVELDGRWRLVKFDHLSHVLHLIALTAIQMGWSINDIPADDMAAELAPLGCNPVVTHHCLHLFGSPSQGRPSGSEISDEGPVAAMEVDGSLWRLDPIRVGCHFARQVLQGVQSMSQEEFLAQWQAALPQGFETPDIGVLKGEVLVDGNRVKLLSLKDLPREPGSRFAALFAERPRWEWTALEPYLKNIKVPGQTAEALLLKYARGSQATPEAPLYYTAR